MMEAKITVMLHTLRETKGYQKLDEARKDPPLEALEGAWPCQYRDFGFLASRIRRE